MPERYRHIGGKYVNLQLTRELCEELYESCLGWSGRPAYDGGMSTAQVEQSPAVPALLKEWRRRLDPSTAMLGRHQRLGSRRGKAVSQEELAEAVGVTREWYACLETGAKQPSLSVLDRLATALNTSAQERVRLFQLAIPVLQDLFQTVTRCPHCNTHLETSRSVC